MQFIAKRHFLLSLAMAIVCVSGTQALAQGSAANAPVPAAPAMQALGKDRYRIGSILVDKKARRLTVGGRILGVDRPLEYLAVTRGGYKSYEALTELDSTGSEFNLACILLGLDANKTKRPEYQFATEPLVGQRVAIEFSWQVGSQTIKATGLQMLLTDAQRAVEKRDDWVYIGSMMLEPTTFGADNTGALAGFVHDPTAVIEHVSGLGIGAYGSVAGNRALLPPDNTRIEMTMTVLNGGAPL
jgi:hypothetical protein